jgi:hypothetical protein
MKGVRTIYVAWIITMILVPRSAGLSGQSPYDTIFSAGASLIRERVIAFTDRSLYTVNESIRFSAFCQVEGLPEGEGWSDVLYAELVTSGGDPVSQAKYPVRDGKCSGSLAIPAGVLTGNYYFRSYTRWMRNRGPADFCYTPLKIVNPFMEEVVPPSNGHPGKELTGRGYKGGNIICLTDRQVYDREQEVRISLLLPPGGGPGPAHCCVTVVPPGAIDTIGGPVIPGGEHVSRAPFSVRFLPDRGGTSVSGRLVRSGGTPLEKPATVHLALLGDEPDYLPVKTDRNGRFVIPVPDRTGVREMFVAPGPGAEEAEVRIDQDFDASPLPVSAGAFTLSGREREIATRMAVHMQLARIYQEALRDEAPGKAGDSAKHIVPFYGTPVQRIDIDEYVTLPTLEEVFINLASDVFVVKRKGKSKLRIQSNNTAIGIYGTLITIDHIPVFDQEKVLAIAPDKIRRIDVINEVYMKGSLAFGGVIAIYSRAGDMAGIDLQENSYFFDFTAFHPSLHEPVPLPAAESRIPDTRNTLLWMDDVVPGHGMYRQFTFRASAEPGEYMVLVRGTLPGGGLCSGTAYFRVK